MTGRQPVLVRVITWLPVGGIERRLVSVLPRLRARGWDARLVCVREEGALAGELRDSGVPVDVIPFRSRLDPRALGKLTDHLRSLGADIVHSHMYRSNVPATIAARRARTPVVFAQVHNVDTWESPRQRALDRFLCRWRTGVISVSEAVRDDVRRNLALPAEKAPVLYNGCDTDLFRPDAALRAAGRGELGAGEHDVVVLVPARLHPNKAPLETLDAFVRARAACPGRALLVFAGAGPLEDALRARITESGAADSVRLLGRRDDMPALYNAADVVLLSSLKEGFSNAVVEALACGRPVIAADVGGNREAIDSPQVGWIHAAGDAEVLERQLKEAIGDPGGLAARADACRRRGLRFSLDALIEDTDTLYRRALEAARK